MLSSFERWAVRVASRQPWTNVYGLARTIVAAATALTLATSPASALWSPWLRGQVRPLGCDGVRGAIGLFCVFPRSALPVVQYCALAALVVVASGWRPRVTGVVHWWISFSFLASASRDGGDQVAALFTLLLIPWTLTDQRRWHWQSADHVEPSRLRAAFLANVSRHLVRLQIMVVYLHSAVSKLYVAEWRRGTAVYYWLHDLTVGLPPPLYGVIGPLVRSWPAAAVLTWGALVTEFLLSLALLAPQRTWRPLFWLGVLFHAAIAVGLGVFSFSVVMIGALVVYLRPEREFGWLLRRQVTTTRTAGSATYASGL